MPVRKARSFCLVSSVVLACSVPLIFAGGPDQRVLEAQARRIAVVERIKPAVVAIFAQGGQGGGSGVLIDKDGYALTNFHVVQGSGPVMQCGLPDGNMYDGVLVGLDKVGDVALIKLLPKKEGQKFPIAKLGDSDKLRAGDWSLAMGNPFLLATDFTPTVTFGLVSGVHRYQPPAGILLEYTDCIQMDTSINPGNSGGPLFNMDGELVGINGRGSFEKRGRVNSGVGYAISINQIKNFMGHLRAGLDVDHATPGFRAVTKSDEDGDPQIMIGSILEDCDAHRRGIDPDDELVSFVGRPVTSVNQFKNVLGLFPKGWRVPITYRRENNKTEVLVRLQGVLPKDMLEGGGPRRPPRGPQPPRPAGPQQEPQKPSPALKLHKAKTGFANWYFNEQAQQKLLAAFAKQGDFSKLIGAWSAEGELERKGGTKSPLKWEVVEQKGEDGKPGTMVVKLNIGGLDYSLEPLKSNQDARDLKDPPGSGGLLMALYQFHRLLTQGAKGFEARFEHGGREPFYPPRTDGTAPQSLGELRVDTEM